MNEYKRPVIMVSITNAYDGVMALPSNEQRQ